MWSIEQVRRVFGQWVLHQMQAKFCPEIVVQRPYWLQCLWQKLRKMRGTEKPSSSLQVFGRWYIIKWFFNSSFVFGCLHVYSLLFVAYLQSFCWFSGVYWCNDVYKRHCCIFSLNTVLIMLAFFLFCFIQLFVHHQPRIRRTQVCVQRIIKCRMLLSLFSFNIETETSLLQQFKREVCLR